MNNKKFNNANEKINNGYEVKSEKRFGFINKLWLNKMKQLLKEYNIFFFLRKK